MAPSQRTLTPHAPPLRCLCWLAGRRLGVEAEVEVVRRGFYPRGGGEVVLKVRACVAGGVWRVAGVWGAWLAACLPVGFAGSGRAIHPACPPRPPSPPRPPTPPPPHRCARCRPARRCPPSTSQSGGRWCASQSLPSLLAGCALTLGSAWRARRCGVSGGVRRGGEEGVACMCVWGGGCGRVRCARGRRRQPALSLLPPSLPPSLPPCLPLSFGKHAHHTTSRPHPTTPPRSADAAVGGAGRSARVHPPGVMHARAPRPGGGGRLRAAAGGRDQQRVSAGRLGCVGSGCVGGVGALKLSAHPHESVPG